MLSHLLVLRMSIVTMIGFALVAFASMQGLVLPLFENDKSHLSYAIVSLFLFGLVSAFYRAGKVGGELNRFKGGVASSNVLWRALKMPGKNEHIGSISDWLQILGVMGTVIGFSISLDGIGADDVTGMVDGLRTAIGTTIVGGFLSLWTSINNQLLRTATSNLIEDVK